MATPWSRKARICANNVGLVAAESGGGLVEDEQPRILGKLAADLDDLAFRDGEIAQFGAGLAFEMERRKLTFRAAQHFAPVDQGNDTREVALRRVLKADIFGDGQRLDELELLMHQRDPRASGIAGPLQQHLAPSHENIAGVGKLFPAEQARQGRFARAVLADNRMDLASVKIDADVAQRFDRPIALRQSAHRDDWPGGGIDGESVDADGQGASAPRLHTQLFAQRFGNLLIRIGL